MPKPKTAPLFFLFLEGQVHLYPSVYFHFHVTDLFVETVFKMYPNTLVTKNTNILNFNSTCVIYNATLNNRLSIQKYVTKNYIIFA